jgi:hypothetical protein
LNDVLLRTDGVVEEARRNSLHSLDVVLAIDEMIARLNDKHIFDMNLDGRWQHQRWWDICVSRRQRPNVAFVKE